MPGLTRFSTMGSVAAATDPQFNLTTLLLHGDGTNGAQNNTFIDSSTNNFAITRNGNTTQGTFTPFSQTGWSAYFDGTGDYLFNSEISAYNVASGQDFTVEGWVYLETSGSRPIFIFGANKTSYGADIGIQVTSASASVRIYTVGSTDGSATTYTASFPSTMPLNQWNHWALVRSSSGTSIKAYLNGVGGSAVTASGAIDPYLRRSDLSSALGIYLGISQSQWDTYNPTYLTGYQSNVRYVVGTALYTANFTPPTAPLTAVTNTQYLSCQSNRFIDTSSNARAITIFGNTSVQAFSPFAPVSAYNTNVVGGSGYFDAAGDYLSTTTAASNYYSALGDWTWEAWVYPLSFSGPQYQCPIMASSIDSLVLRVLPTAGISGNLNMYAVNSSNGAMIGTSGTNGSVLIKLNEWSHVAIQRRSGEFDLFLNGIRVANNATQTAVSIRTTDTAFYIGSANAGSNPFWNGYISGVRVQNGTAKYPSTTYTIPTAPPSPTGAAICANFTNAGIIDNTSKNDLETVGNVQISTAVKKFGTGSLAFSGGSYLYPNSSVANSVLGSGDFTVEFWLYTSSGSATYNILDYRPNATAGVYLTFYLSSGTPIVYVSSAARITGSATIPATTWTHVAICRSGTSTKMFIDGVQSGSTYTDTNVYLGAINRPAIGGGGQDGTSTLNGYIDDLRISKFARYTANFTPPTAAFPDQ